MKYYLAVLKSSDDREEYPVYLTNDKQKLLDYLDNVVKVHCSWHKMTQQTELYLANNETNDIITILELEKDTPLLDV